MTRGETTRLLLELELGADPLIGRIRRAGGDPAHFAGYLELIAALEGARRAPGGATTTEASEGGDVLRRESARGLPVGWPTARREVVDDRVTHEARDQRRELAGLLANASGTLGWAVCQALANATEMTLLTPSRPAPGGRRPTRTRRGRTP